MPTTAATRLGPSTQLERKRPRPFVHGQCSLAETHSVLAHRTAVELRPDPDESSKYQLRSHIGQRVAARSAAGCWLAGRAGRTAQRSNQHCSFRSLSMVASTVHTYSTSASSHSCTPRTSIASMYVTSPYNAYIGIPHIPFTSSTHYTTPHHTCASEHSLPRCHCADEQPLLTCFLLVALCCSSHARSDSLTAAILHATQIHAAHLPRHARTWHRLLLPCPLLCTEPCMLLACLLACSLARSLV